MRIESKNDVDGEIIQVESKEDEYVTVNSTNWCSSTDDTMNKKLNELVEQCGSLYIYIYI